MTIKELSDVAGVSTDTIKREIKKQFPCKIKNGVKTVLDEQESISIIKGVKKKNLVSLPTQNAQLPTQNAQVDYEAIAKIVSIAVVSAMQPLIKELRQPQNNNVLMLTGDTEAPVESPRIILRKLVDEYVAKNKVGYSEAWNKLYNEFYYRASLNVKQRAKNQGIKPIDWLERNNKLMVAIGFIKELLK